MIIADFFGFYLMLVVINAMIFIINLDVEGISFHLCHSKIMRFLGYASAFLSIPLLVALSPAIQKMLRERIDNSINNQ